jgi:lantibiotic modifying enzyme
MIDWSDLDGLKSGMAHGRSGLAVGMLALSELVQDTELAKSAHELLRYEVKLLQANSISSTTWCNGLPGIAIALQQLLNESNSKPAPEVRHVLDSLEFGLKEDDCLCHGNMGDLEALLNFYQLDHTGHVKQLLNHKLTQILERKRRIGDYTFRMVEGYPTVGLFLGLSGIGYTLLRIYNQNQIPNVLNLSLPGS